MTTAGWSIPPGSITSFPPGTPIATVVRARDKAHRGVLAVLDRVLGLAEEIAELADQKEEPEPQG